MTNLNTEMTKLNTEARELTIDELDSASGGSIWSTVAHSILIGYGTAAFPHKIS